MTGKALRNPAGVAAFGFIVTFAAVRTLTYSIHFGIAPFHDVSAGGTHIHHMVWGILLLLAAGYFRLHDGRGARKTSGWAGWLMAAAYGAGAALTLDELALWLNMRDVYWQFQGWESVVAVLVFAVVLVATAWGARFVQAAIRAITRHRVRSLWPDRVAVAGE